MTTSGDCIHATSVAIGGAGILITGKSGAGKSDLALRLIDRGAQLVSDDYTRVKAAQGKLIASAPETISGKIEVRGVGIFEVAALAEAAVALVVSIDSPMERMPDGTAQQLIAGISIPSISLSGLEPSAPLKVEWALRKVQRQ